MYDQWWFRELADRLLPATKQQGTKVTPILVTRNTNTNTKQPGTKVISSEINSQWPNFISGDCPGRHVVGRAQAGRRLRTSSSASCRGKNFLLRSKLSCQFSISINFRRHVMVACYLHPKHDLSQGEGDETAMLLYTSGATSGSPRGVTLSHSILGRQVINWHIMYVVFALPCQFQFWVAR